MNRQSLLIGEECLLQTLYYVLLSDQCTFGTCYSGAHPLAASALVCSVWLQMVCMLLDSVSAVFGIENYAEQGSAEWHQRRRFRITAAKIAGICGLGWYCWLKKPEYYETSQQAYRKWTEQPLPGESFEILFMMPCEYGTTHEERVRCIMQRLLGCPIREAGSFDQAQDRWLGMSPDGLIPPMVLEVEMSNGRKRRLFVPASLLEVKTSPGGGLPVMHREDAQGLDQLVAYYKIAHAAQIMQQLFIARRTTCWHPYYLQDALLVFFWQFTPALWAWCYEQARWQYEQYQAGVTDLPAPHPFAQLNPLDVEDLWFNQGRNLTPAQRRRLPPAPRVLLVYSQLERLGTLALDTRDPLRDRECWPGSPPESDPIYQQWKTFPEMPTGPVQMRITKIQHLTHRYLYKPPPKVQQHKPDLVTISGIEFGLVGEVLGAGGVKHSAEDVQVPKGKRQCSQQFQQAMQEFEGFDLSDF